MPDSPCCTRMTVSPASTTPPASKLVPLPFMSIKTSHPTCQLPNTVEHVRPSVDRQTVAAADRFRASERAKVMSLTKLSAAAVAARLASKLWKLGTAIDAKMAAIATTTISSINVKPVWRIFMVWSLFRPGSISHRRQTTGQVKPPNGKITLNSHRPAFAHCDRPRASPRNSKPQSCASKPRRWLRHRERERVGYWGRVHP